MLICLLNNLHLNLKHFCILLSVLLFLASCHESKLSPTEKVTQYYNGFDQGRFSEIREVMYDTLTIVSGDFVTPYSHESFYEFFKWDSIFRSTYKIQELSQKNEKVLVTIRSESLKYKFLENNPLTTKFAISFTDDKISRIEDLGSETADWALWQTKRDTLVNYIKKYHPELNGFINDMSMKGAQDYLKAMRYYRDQNSSD